jgi:hypothetical protein
MDMFYDEEFQEPNPPKDKKIGPTNPKGPYTFLIKFKGYEYTVQIENKSYTKFKILVDCDKNVPEQDLTPLNRYIEAEGFLIAATKWNLYY